MFFLRPAFLGALGATYLSISTLASDIDLKYSDTCVPEVILVEISTTQVVQPMFLTYLVPTDMVITIGGGCTVNVTNAPTILSTLLTCTTLSTVSKVIGTHRTTSISTTSTSSRPSALPIPQIPGLSNKTIIPYENQNIDRSDLANLKPSYTAVLDYAETFGSGFLFASLTFTMLFPQVTLENSEFISSVTCTSTSITLILSSETAFDICQQWPQTNLVLITNCPSCNPSNARGVWMVTSFVVDPKALSIVFHVDAADWKVVAETLKISYGNLVAGGHQPSSYISTATKYYTHGSTLTSATFLTTVTPTAFTTTSFSQASGSSVSPSSRQLPTSGSTSLPNQMQQSASATTSKISNPTTSSTPPFQSGNTTINNSTLPPGAQVIYDQILASVKYDANGNIILDLGNKSSSSNTALAAPYQPDNTTLQALIQAEFLEDGLTPVDALVNEAISDLGSAFFTIYGITPNMNVVEVLPSGYDVMQRTSTASNAAPTSSTIPRVKNRLRSLSQNTKRSILGDIFNIANDILTDDAIDAMCDICDDISDIEDAYDASLALYQMTHPSQGPPPATVATYTSTCNADVTLSNGAITQDGKGGVIFCSKCGLHVSSLVLSGEVVVVIGTNSIIVAVITATLNAETDLVFEMQSKGPYSGSTDNAITTLDFDSLTIPSILVFTPKFFYGIGATWEADTAIDITAGASMTYTNAVVNLDLVANAFNGANGWQPQATITYPTLTTAGHVVLTPYIKTSIELSIQILNSVTPNAAGITMQTSLGFSAEVLDQTITLSRRDNLVERGFFSLIQQFLAQQALAASLVPMAQAPPTCPAGALDLTTTMNTQANVYFNANAPQNIFTTTYPFGQQCITPSGFIPGASSTARPSSTSSSTSMTVSAISSSSSSSRQLTGSTSVPRTLPTLTSTRSSLVLSTTLTSSSTSSSPLSSSSTTSSPSTTPNTGPNCPTGYTGGQVTFGGSIYSLSCGATMTWSNSNLIGTTPFTTMDQCLNWCNSYGSACAVAVWQPTSYENCILLSSPSWTGAAAGPAAVAERVTATPTTTPSACPSGLTSGSNYISGVPYTLTCGGSTMSYDSSNEIGTSPQATFSTCLAWCNSWGSYCEAAIWDPSSYENCIILTATGTITPAGSSSQVFAVRSSSGTPSTSASTTSSATPACTLTAIQNGGFESRSISPGWSVAGAPGYSSRIISPGHNSNYAFSATDAAISNGAAVVVQQTLSTCPGVTYSIEADYQFTKYVSDSSFYIFVYEGGQSKTIVQIQDSGTSLTGTWGSMSGTFTPTTSSPLLEIYMENYGTAITYLIDNVIVTPVVTK